MQHPPKKGRDSVKLTALSTVIPETPRTEEGAQLLAAPPMHEIQQRETLKDYLKHSDGTRDKTEDERNRASRRMKQEDNTSKTS